MAENAELLLKVGLDLQHFRRQLNNIGSQLAGQPISISVKLDRTMMADQFRLFDRYIRNKKFRVEVNTNLKTEVDRAEKLVEKLNEIKRIASGISGVSTQAARGSGVAGGVATANYKELQALYQFAKEAKIPFEQLKRGAASSAADLRRVLGPAFVDVAEDIKNGIKTGLADANSTLAKLGTGMGEALLGAIKASLGIASPSKETGKLGKFAAEGFVLGFINNLIRSERKIANAVTRAAVGFIYEGLSAIGDLGPAFVPLERQLKAGALRAARRALKDGFKEGILPGVKGGLLGLLGGGATGGLIGGGQALGGGLAAGLAQLGAGGQFGVMKQMGRLATGDTAGLIAYVQELAGQVIEQAFSTGTLGALVGTAAVAGVAGASGFVKGTAGSLTKQIIELITNKILSDIATVLSGELGNVAQKHLKQIVTALMQGLERRMVSTNIAFPSMLPALPPAYRGLPQAGGNAFGALPPAYRGLPGRTTPMLPPAYRGLPMGGFDFAAMGAIPKSGASDDPGGKIVSLESGFIAAMRERFARAAERYLFGVETQVFDLYDAAVRQVEVAVDQYIAKIQAQISQRARQSVSVVDLGATTQRLLRGGVTGRDPLMLPPIGGTVASRRMGGGYVPPGGFPTEGAMAPQSQYRAARTDLGPGYLAGGQLAKALKEIDPVLRQARVPLAGAIEELGSEFGNAVKQVLLFGTAYKALAFVTALPGQALQASTALQTFRNQLLAVAGGATQADQAFEFVDSLAQRFNVPLQTARQGFIKLYASMQPAGFEPEQINNLFEGISKAAATFGLSADKVDRVNYAFAQMASKGQIMSEELKGQLGDVLPGALGLFAEAAQMSIPEFSKAMEDGAFTGTAMAQVLDNVATLLNTKFTGAAEGASKTLQGQLNAMQNALQAMYEAFEPIVNTLASNLFPILSQSIADAGSAVNALAATMMGSTGPANMLSGNARAIYEAFNQVKEIGSALFTIIRNLAPTFETLGRTVLLVLGQFARFINTPIGQFLSNVAIQTALVTSALQLMAKLGLVQAIAGLIQLVTNTRGAIASLQLLIATSKTAQLAMIGLGAGIVLAALTTLIGKLNEVYARMLDIQRGAQNAAQAIAAMSQTEATVAARRYQNQVAVLKKFQAETRGKGGLVTATAAEINAMAAAGATPGVAFTGPLVDKQKGVYGAGTIAPEMAESAIQRLSQLESAARFQARPVATAAPALQKIDFGAGAGTGRAGGGADKAANEAKRLAEEIARQAAAASDALFSEQQRFAVLKETEPVAKAFAEYSSREATIQRELNQSLAEARSQEEKLNIVRKSALQSRASSLELERDITQAGKEALKTIEQIVVDQEKQLRLEQDVQQLMSEGMTPERAKQVAEVKKLVREQLKAIDQQILQTRAVIEERAAREGSTKAVEDLRKALQGLEEDRKKAEGKGREAEEGVPETKPKTAQDYISEGMDAARKNLEELTNAGYQLVQAAGAIGDAFGESFKGLISGSMTAQQALANFFQSIGDYFADMAAKMIAEWIKMQIIGLAQSLLPGIGGIFGGAQSGLSGTGALSPGGFGMSVPTYAGVKFATGGIAPGGFKAFANGGLVTGPTMGLVGEGRYNEAIVPLPDGRSIPVELKGAMGGNISVVVNVDATGSEAAGDESQAKALGNVVSAAVQAEIIKQKRPGGLLAR